MRQSSRVDACEGKGRKAVNDLGGHLGPGCGRDEEEEDEFEWGGPKEDKEDKEDKEEEEP